MNPTERIEVRKIYVGRAALFGLLYGLIIGLIFGIFFFVMALAGTSNINFLGRDIKILSVGVGAVIAIGIVIFSSIASCISAAVGAVLYNLIAMMGGMLHLGLAEHEVKQA